MLTTCHILILLGTGYPLQDMVSESGAVIFIYPKAHTSGCTTQVRSLNSMLLDWFSNNMSPDVPLPHRMPK